MNTHELERLRAFRHQLYRILECRRDALFELMDAVLTSSVIESLAHLSLASGFQRTWGSVYDALNQGTLASDRWEALLGEYPLETETNWYAIDGSVWPRCDAETSPERGYYHHHSRHSNGQPIVAGWNYSWLVQIPERCSSWTAPLRVRRVIPGETINAIAVEQIRSHQRQCHKKAMYSMDSGYDPVAMGVALKGEEDVHLLIRLRSGRCFYADPPNTPTGGRPKRHGKKFTCDEPSTWWKPTQEWNQEDDRYGQVRLRAWSGLHAIPATHGKHAKPQAKPIVTGWVILVEVAAAGGEADRADKARSGHHTSPMRGGTPSQTDQTPRTALALVVGPRASVVGRGVAGVHFAICDRAYVSLFQTGVEVDHPQTPLTSGSRSLDLALNRGLCPTASRSAVGRRPSPALATSPSSRTAHARTRSSVLFRTFAETGQSSERPKSLRTIAWSAKRAAFATCQTHSGCQIDRMSRGFSRMVFGFPTCFDNVGTLLLVKSQAK